LKGVVVSIGTVLVFIDFTPAGELRTEYAIQLCLRHGAHLIGVFVAPPGWAGNAVESYVRGEAAMRRVVRQNRVEAALAEEAASLDFQAAIRREPVSFEFRVVHEQAENELAVLNSLHADLIVVGTPGPGGLPDHWSPEAMLMASGVPIIVLPSTWMKTSPAERILLAWNATAIARRAITDSLSLLKAAKSVCVVVVDADKNPRHGEEPGADIALYITRHGVKVTLKNIKSDGHSVAEAIQNTARHKDIDLIVIGAFGHSRVTSLILGSVTRSLLASAKTPLLLAH
jgi:nucleotide-binding universal stress UspA family protein